MNLGHFLSMAGFIGINWTWAAMTIHFHTLISICSSFILTELLYPSRRNQPWLTRKYFIYVLPVYCMDSGDGIIMIKYTGRAFPPVGLYCLSLNNSNSAGLDCLLPSKTPIPIAIRSVPSPLLFFLIGLINMSIFFVSVFLTADYNFPPLFYTMLFLIVLDVITLWVINYFSGHGYCWMKDMSLLDLRVPWILYLFLF